MSKTELEQFMLLNREGMETALRRYEMLRGISYVQPVGRRQMAVYSGRTEREVRAECDALKLAGLIRVEPSGMLVSREGYKLLAELEQTVYALRHTGRLEDDIRDGYGIKQVSIVSGDVDTHALVRRDIGICAAMQMRKYMKQYRFIALTGHNYVSLMADGRYPDGIGRGVTLYPARTAQMNHEDIDANTNCARLGKKSGAGYRLLHLGENPSLNEIEKRYHDEDVQQIVSAVENADILVSGLTPLKKSQLFASMSVRAKDGLMQSAPCCELLGNFIKADGKQINNPPLYSLSVDRMAKYKVFMLLAAGADETAGIHALVMRFKNMHLITDERTANRLMMYNLNK